MPYVSKDQQKQLQKKKTTTIPATVPLEFVISSWIKIIPAINTITTPAKATIAANRSRRSFFARVFIPLSSTIFEDISASYPLILEEK